MKKTLILLLAALSPLVSYGEMNEQQAADVVAYFLGRNVATQFKASGVDKINPDSISQGAADVYAGKDPRYSQEELQQALADFKSHADARRDAEAKANLETGQAFLTENAGKPDVVVLPSGLQYRVIESGTGATPTEDDRVKVNYQGKLIDGTVFDSSIERGQPAEFPLKGVIPGFREAITHMKVGDRWEVFVPSSLAYGAEGAGGSIGPNQALIFELDLLDIVH